MLRITRTDHPRHILLVIEGKLAGDNVGVIASTCEEALSTGAAVTVFLKDITGIDVSGQECLKRLAQTRARVRALGIYSRFLVRRLLNDGSLPCVS